MKSAGMLRTAVYALLFIAAGGCALPSSSCMQPGSGSSEVPSVSIRSESAKAPSPNLMRIYMIDVGQGDSALVIFPDGRTILVDSGVDWEGKSIINLLGRLGIGGLDILVASHGHPDHTRGFSAVISGGYTAPDMAAYSYEDGSWNGVTWCGVQPGEVIYKSGGATAACYAVGGRIVDGTYVDPGRDKNARSVVLNVKFGGFDYLTGGDLTGAGNHNIEDPLGEALAALGIHVDVYKVHHHGSRHSSNLYFLQKIMPEFAMISVGDGNYFRHPTQGAINRLNDSTVHVERIFQTENGSSGTAPNVTVANGQIVITTDGVHYGFTNEGPGSAAFAFGPYPVDECVWPMFRHEFDDKGYAAPPDDIDNSV